MCPLLWLARWAIRWVGLAKVRFLPIGKAFDTNGGSFNPGVSMSTGKIRDNLVNNLALEGLASHPGEVKLLSVS